LRLNGDENVVAHTRELRRQRLETDLAYPVNVAALLIRPPQLPDGPLVPKNQQVIVEDSELLRGPDPKSNVPAAVPPVRQSRVADVGSILSWATQ
jgi:hypothetical protein